MEGHERTMNSFTEGRVNNNEFIYGWQNKRTMK